MLCSEEDVIGTESLVVAEVASRVVGCDSSSDTVLIFEDFTSGLVSQRFHFGDLVVVHSDRSVVLHHVDESLKTDV